ncbi:alpha/beta hydrolase [Pseudomonas sp. ICMP22404]|uniref:alpha/beta fold hydrolase n=1 Tax=Pseudomonas sp. ICMP22404 TaxID=2583807 RepID=UPI00111B66A6|nr:alpha/beta hydrolase [Pseudomonas sp. ICMP22404]TNF83416.1 alpha/beta hydrolase [Pseudomonas sp. ICMP22404]
MFSAREWPDSGVEGFKRGFETVDGTRIHYVSGGVENGEVMVLVCGFPQSWYAWRKVLPLLGKHYRVIAPDLPGQGDSDRPSSCDTGNVSRLLRKFLTQVGVEKHSLVVHDIGAWVGYPYCAQFGDSVTGLAILDTGIPGISLPDNLPWAADAAWRTWHVAFHNIPDLPEELLEGREHIYLKWYLQRKAANPQIFTEEDFAEYLRAFRLNGWKGGLAYYRATTQSAEQNREFAKTLLKMPVLAVRADQGSMPDLVSELKKVAANVSGTMVKSGHYIPEEQPNGLVDELLKFFSNVK